MLKERGVEAKKKERKAVCQNILNPLRHIAGDQLQHNVIQPLFTDSMEPLVIKYASSSHGPVSQTTSRRVE